MAKIRSPICVVVGHVDHGKSSLLDRIRGTTIVETEAGRITQAIGASIVPIETIRRTCGAQLAALKINFNIPGLLFIDTPGHAAFTSLRKRGGNIADIAILVIDINEGFKPQTVESIEILKAYRTPFVIAANKVDLISGWKSRDGPILSSVKAQEQRVIAAFETRMYEIVGKLSEMGIEGERFDRVENYTKQVAIIPVSAVTGEGIPELLMVIAGLAQRYLEQSLRVDVSGMAQGIILEVKDEKGLGKTLDVIIHDGTLKVNDTIVVGGLEKPIITKVRALFEPAPLAEMRDKKTKFKSVSEAVAATGVKISSPGVEKAVAGMPVRACEKGNCGKVCTEIMKEVEEVIITTDKEGVVIKADTIGSLEAMTTMLRQRNVLIKRAEIGNITKKDIMEAEANIEKYPCYAVVIGFNITSDITDTGKVKVFLSNIIYRLLEDYEQWVAEETKKKEQTTLGQLVRPCKLRIMPGYIFRQKNPAVCGVEMLAGKVTAGTSLINIDGEEITTIKGIQKEQENVTAAQENEQVAMSLDKVTVGRNLHESDILYSSINEEDFRRLKEMKKFLSDKEIDVLKEIAGIRRKGNPTWGL